MEKKTKLTITLALAVLVITLSLGAAISIAPNESGAQIAAQNQQQMKDPIENQQQMKDPIENQQDLLQWVSVRMPPEVLGHNISAILFVTGQWMSVRTPPTVLGEAQSGACCAPTTCGVFYVTAVPTHEAQTIYTASPLADRMLFTITCTNTEDVMTVSIPPLPNEVIRTGNSLTFYGQVTGDIKVWPSGTSSEARGFYCATIVKP